MLAIGLELFSLPKQYNDLQSHFIIIDVLEILSALKELKEL